MAKRFKLLEESFTGVSVYVDRETGVEYGGYGGSLIPLLDANGSVKINAKTAEKLLADKRKKKAPRGE
ncbi:DUF6440 family protein [Lactobacillaceae bacterium Melli_B4]